jgi:hypothetical protein
VLSFYNVRRVLRTKFLLGSTVFRWFIVPMLTFPVGVARGGNAIVSSTEHPVKMQLVPSFLHIDTKRRWVGASCHNRFTSRENAAVNLSRLFLDAGADLHMTENRKSPLLAGIGFRWRNS